MAKIQLYYDGLSQPCRAVYLFMKMNNIEFELKHITIMKGETLTPEFKQLNPFGGVPFINDNGFILSESAAIMLYLYNKYDNISDHWYPKCAQQRARVDQFLSWYHTGIRKYASRVFGEKAYTPFNTRKPLNVVAYEQHKKDLEPSLQKFEELYLQDDGFIFGQKDISIADLLALSELTQPICAQHDFRQAHPRIQQYMERVKTRLEPHYEVCFQRIYFMGEKLSEGKSGPEILPANPDDML